MTGAVSVGAFDLGNFRQAVFLLSLKVGCLLLTNLSMGAGLIDTLMKPGPFSLRTYR